MQGGEVVKENGEGGKGVVDGGKGADGEVGDGAETLVSAGEAGQAGDLNVWIVEASEGGVLPVLALGAVEDHGQVSAASDVERVGPVLEAVVDGLEVRVRLDGPVRGIWSGAGSREEKGVKRVDADISDHQAVCCDSSVVGNHDLAHAWQIDKLKVIGKPKPWPIQSESLERREVV